MNVLDSLELMGKRILNVENMKLINFKIMILILRQYYQLLQQTPELHSQQHNS